MLFKVNEHCSVIWGQTYKAEMPVQNLWSLSLRQRQHYSMIGSIRIKLERKFWEKNFQQFLTFLRKIVKLLNFPKRYAALNFCVSFQRSLLWPMVPSKAMQWAGQILVAHGSFIGLYEAFLCFWSTSAVLSSSLPSFFLN